MDFSHIAWSSQRQITKPSGVSAYLRLISVKYKTSDWPDVIILVYLIPGSNPQLYIHHRNLTHSSKSESIPPSHRDILAVIIDFIKILCWDFASSCASLPSERKTYFWWIEIKNNTSPQSRTNTSLPRADRWGQIVHAWCIRLQECRVYDWGLVVTWKWGGDWALIWLYSTNHKCWGLSSIWG